MRVCGEERRALVTLDLDSANPFRFPPAEPSGVAVPRLPWEPGRSSIPEWIGAQAIARGERLEGKLRIVESGRIRVFLDED